MAQGISVRRPASAHHSQQWPNHGDVEATRTGGHAKTVSSGVVPRSHRYTDFESYGTGGRRESSLYHTRSASNVLDLADSRAPDAISRTQSSSNLLSRQEQPKYQHKEPAHGYTPGLLELVEFFRTYEPPASNLMSVADDTSLVHEERGRWSRFRHMGGMVKRSKSISHSQSDRPIQLPDSAVSGRTSAGHRHIAISIPNDASPYGTKPRSQYPVYRANDAVEQGRPSRTGKAEHVRYTNQQGGITVLPQLQERNEVRTTVPSFPGFSRHKLPPIPGPAPTTALPPVGQRTKTPNQSKSSDFIRAAAESASFVTGKDRTMRRTKSTTVPPRSTSATHGSHPPVAMASMHRAAFSRPSSRPSIDNIIALSPKPERPVGAMSKSRPISTSSTTQDEEPILGLSATFTHDGSYSNRDPKTKRKSLSMRHSMDVPSSAREETLPRTIITELEELSPSMIEKCSEASSSRPQTAQERREKVRGLKKRDMESLRPKKNVDRQNSADSLLSSPKERPQTAHSYVPTNSFTPIMVVADVQPEEDKVEESKPWTQRKRKDLEITTPGTGYITKVEKEQIVKSLSKRSAGLGFEQAKSMTIPQQRRAARARASLAPIVAPGSANPTPPHSPTSAPQTLTVSEDRTSLARRREWNAAKSLKTPVVAEAMEAVKARMRDIMGSNEHLEEEQMVSKDQEFLRLYDAYREHRLQDMEKRVKRLERNGDVWRRALVPVLENLTRPSTGIQARRRSQTDRMEEIASPCSSGLVQTRGRPRHRQSIGHCSTSTPAAKDDTRSDTGGSNASNSPTESEGSGLSETLDNTLYDIAMGARERLARRGRQATTA